MMKIYKAAGERILMIRNMRGYTRECLAEMADISEKFLYEIETGRKGFSAIVLYNLSLALGVGCDYIMTGCEGNSYDSKLGATLELFEHEQTENLDVILRAIYRLSKEIY